jgi:hypothetical protein
VIPAKSAMTDLVNFIENLYVFLKTKKWKGL